MARGAEVVTVIRKAVMDPLDDPIDSASGETEVRRCIVLPRASNEQGHGWVQRSGYTIYAPPNADIRATDTLRVRGERQNVIGKPGLLSKKSGRAVNLVVTTEAIDSRGQ